MRLFDAVPLWVKALIAGALLVAIVAGFRACTAITNHQTDVAASAARGEGVATAVAEGMKGVLKDAETANKAGAAVAAGGQSAYDVCVRTSDTPRNCPTPTAR
ncbi:hypothetical protein [Sphingopyxis sp. SCN 67-31]|uniref:hypothetical protein n=1 Tax=Sphingopyxis sp. SCN 67-31 TaxID=1660142 RepID=UPI00086DBE72|nr:hypothetical protein [Sphingopyxis sp. SCN 67-31]ODU28979.1 MAG: hypothetical protein ABS88_10640 [Sphingopyxis sp. SCN 67-31]